MTPDKFASEIDELQKDILGQCVCRRYKQSVKDWWYVRRESLVTLLLRPDEFPEVGLGWRCVCGALHLGEPLPRRTTKGRAWNSNDDYTVTVMGNRCPIIYKNLPSEPRPAIGKRRTSGEAFGLNTPHRSGGGSAAVGGGGSKATPEMDLGNGEKVSRVKRDFLIADVYQVSFTIIFTCVFCTLI